MLDTVDDAVLLQNRRFCLIYSIVDAKCKLYDFEGNQIGRINLPWGPSLTSQYTFTTLSQNLL